MPSKPAVPSAIAEARARIKEAERKLEPVAREAVGVDAQGYETIAVLIERGIGRRADVLRRALATGLRVMLQGSEEQTFAPAPTGYDYEDAPKGEEPGNEVPTDALVRAALGLGALPQTAFVQPGTAPLAEGTDADALAE